MQIGEELGDRRAIEVTALATRALDLLVANLDRDAPRLEQLRRAVEVYVDADDR